MTMKRLNMINKIYILFICLITVPFALNGQPNSNVIDEMNNVKLNESFIFGEGFHVRKDVAQECAISEILSYAIELRFDNGNNEKLQPSDIQPIVKQLIHFDGNQYNVFLYVDREQILSMSGHIESPKISSNADPRSEPKELVVSDKTQNSQMSKGTSLEDRFKPLPNDVLYTLCNQDNWTEIKGFLSTYKNQGKIRETGFCTNLSEIPVDAYRILIDDKYGILAILAPKDSDNRININTNQIDKESNYSNCAVIVWLK